MKILLLTDHSHASQPLAAISARNHWEYSARHGYDLLTIRREWAEVLKAPFEPIIRLISQYDCIMAVGSDVLFTNFNKRVEDVILSDDNFVLAMEPYDWPSYFNLGVMLICNTIKSFRLMRNIDMAEPEWWNMRLTCQDWLNIHYREYVDTLRFVPTRIMNSPNHGIEQWQPGDWLIHYYGEPNKAELMRKFLQCNCNISRP